MADDGNTARRGISRRSSLIWFTLFAALSAIGGGAEMLIWPGGNEFVPIELLESTPFETFAIPGVLLAFVVGLSNLMSTVLVWRRSRFAIDATLLAGGALTIWIVAEFALMRELHWLHMLYGGLGIVVLGLGVDAARQSGVARHRWTVAVTLAESVGYLFPAAVGLYSAHTGWSAGPQALAMIPAGFMEGLFLGAGQAWAFQRPVRRRRYALLTAVGAALVWGSVMGTMWLGETGASAAVQVGVGVVVGVVGLGAIGTLQWVELRHHAERAWRWVGWTALAWIAALPLSFAPGPLVDEATPVITNAVVWICGGILMAYVMALVTWQGARRVVGLGAGGQGKGQA